jgi:hypothetical protein
MVFKIRKIKWTVHIFLKIILYWKDCVVQVFLFIKLRDLEFVKFRVKYGDPESV